MARPVDQLDKYLKVDQRQATRPYNLGGGLFHGAGLDSNWRYLMRSFPLTYVGRHFLTCYFHSGFRFNGFRRLKIASFVALFR
jgi:hypothetical protein